MSNTGTLRIYSDQATLAEMLAYDVITYLRAMQEEGREAFIALSGGSTPTLLFREMAKLQPSVNWDQVRFFWVDERCVPPDHPESNFGVAKREFLDPLGIPGSSYHRIRGEDDPADEARRYSDLIMDTVSPEMTFPVFDRIFLGMGADGHTASIFPHEIALWNEEKLCAVGTHPGSGQKRITFTGHLINAASRVTFLVSGKEKQPVVEQVIRATGDHASFPASLVKPHNGELEWYIDREAAGTLK